MISMSNLTPAQQRAVAAATRLAPDPAWSRGITDGVLDRLPGDGPWQDSQVNAAITDMILSLGIDMPIAGAG